MDIIILSEKENELEIQVKGETHTLLNIIKSELLEDQRIETAFYDLKSLTNSVSKDPILYIKTSGNENPLFVFKDISKKIGTICDDFSLSFKNAVLNYRK